MHLCMTIIRAPLLPIPLEAAGAPPTKMVRIYQRDGWGMSNNIMNNVFGLFTWRGCE